MTDQELLSDYVARNSEPAFAELVRRHIDLVYSAALRMLRDSHAAEDVTQAVFLLLAQRARDLTDRLALEGWLHCTARNLAVKLVRSEVRRRTREQKAVSMEQLIGTDPDPGWEGVAPHLDEAMSQLSDLERDALLLRYFKNKDFRSVGATLGISEDAAQKRVGRAVAKLREALSAQGLSVSGSGLALLISANATQAAPASLSGLIAATASLATPAAAASVATQTTMSWITAKSVTAMIASALMAGTAAWWVSDSGADRLRAENQRLLQHQSALLAERDTALASANAAEDERNRIQSNERELLRLRGEVGPLREGRNELETLRAENARLRSAIVSNSSLNLEPPVPPGQEQVKEHLGMARNFALAMIMYAMDNENLLPKDLDGISRYVNDEIRTNLTHFEILAQGYLNNISNPASTLIVRQKAPVLREGKWTKVYAFADGHAEALEEPSEGFSAWEEKRLMTSGGTQNKTDF